MSSSQAKQEDTDSSTTSLDRPPSSSKAAWLWDTVGLDKEERRFILKLDATLLVFGWIGMTIKWIDQTNITNAFVSGMREDVGLLGNEYNYIVLAYTIGHIIGQMPSNLILTRVPAHLWIPFLELGWTIFTFALAGAKSYRTLLGLRFMVGLFESGFWPAMYHLLGSFYTKRELGKRNGILQSAVYIAPIFSGFLQSGLYTGLNGAHGIPGWRWLFIMNGVISLPLALLAFVFLPDVPSKMKPNWIFSAEDITLANRRMSLARRAPEGKPYTVGMITGFLTSWKTVLFAMAFTLQPVMLLPLQSFVFWLKAHNLPGRPLVYTIPQINQYPAMIYGFACATMLIFVWLSDGPFRGRRWPTILFSTALALPVFVLLVVTPVFGPFRHRATLYILAGISWASVPLIMAWMSELISDNAEQRAFTAALMNSLQYTTLAWAPLVWFKQTSQPAVRSGNIAAAVAAGLSLIVYTSIIVCQSREKKRKAKSHDGEKTVTNDAEHGSEAEAKSVMSVGQAEEVPVIGFRRDV